MQTDTEQKIYNLLTLVLRNHEAGLLPFMYSDVDIEDIGVACLSVKEQDVFYRENKEPQCIKESERCGLKVKEYEAEALRIIEETGGLDRWRDIFKAYRQRDILGYKLLHTQSRHCLAYDTNNDIAKAYKLTAKCFYRKRKAAIAALSQMIAGPDKQTKRRARKP